MRKSALITAILFLICALPGLSYAGTTTTCAQVQQVTASGISGGVAGYTSSGQQCFSGGGSSFCGGGPSFNYTYTCAGSTITGDPAATEWLAFDPPESLSETERQEYIEFSTRDDDRGRAGKNAPLFMDKYEVCRAIDNTTDVSTHLPMYLGVKDPDEWRSVHGVADGGDLTDGGYSHMGNDSSLPTLQVCCAPQIVEVCGVETNTGYVIMGDTVQISVPSGGYTEVTCVANNTLRVDYVTGICDSSGGGGTPSGGIGYHNPTTGGYISQADYPPGGVAGYGQVGHNVQTNPQGVADMAAAQATNAQNVTDAAAAAAAAEAAEQAAIEAAQAAAEAAEAAAQDDDDDD